MNFVHRGMTIAAMIFLASAALAGTSSFAADLERPDTSGTPTMAVAHSLAPPPAATPASQAAVPAMRRLEADGAITGSEPDPESFDAKGLETWWQHYREALKKAE